MEIETNLARDQGGFGKGKCTQDVFTIKKQIYIDIDKEKNHLLSVYGYRKGRVRKKMGMFN